MVRKTARIYFAVFLFLLYLHQYTGLSGYWIKLCGWRFCHARHARTSRQWEIASQNIPTRDAIRARSASPITMKKTTEGISMWTPFALKFSKATRPRRATQ